MFSICRKCGVKSMSKHQPGNCFSPKTGAPKNVSVMATMMAVRVLNVVPPMDPKQREAYAAERLSKHDSRYI